MKKLLLSLLTIVLTGSLVAGATSAVFSSTATVDDNTFATGTLEIRVDGQPVKAGFTFTAAAPGDCETGQFGVNNYGQPWFVGPSTLDAKQLVLMVGDVQGDTSLFNALTIKVEANRGWPTWMPVYNGNLSTLVSTEGDLLGTRWNELIPGSSEDVSYEVCLPDTADNSLQGLSTSFDFLVTAYNPVRP